MPTLKFRDPADGLWKPVDGFVQPHPQCRLNSTVSQTAQTTGTLTTVIFDAVDYDTGGMADIGNNRILIPMDGYYRISFRVSFTNNATGYRAAIIYKNASLIIVDSYVMASSNSGTILTGTSEPIYLVQGDNITMRSVQASGASIQMLYANSSGQRLAVEYAGLVGPNGVSGASVTTLAATTDVVVKGASLPRGMVGYDEMDPGTTLTSASATMVDSSMTTTVVAPAGRLYKITAQMHPRSSVANDRCLMTILDGASQIQISQGAQLVTAASGYTQQVVAVHAPTAASHVYKCQFSRFSGTGTITVSAAATAPSFLLVEDLGAA